LIVAHCDERSTEVRKPQKYCNQYTQQQDDDADIKKLKIAAQAGMQAKQRNRSEAVIPPRHLLPVPNDHFKAYTETDSGKSKIVAGDPVHRIGNKCACNRSRYRPYYQSEPRAHSQPDRGKTRGVSSDSNKGSLSEMDQACQAESEIQPNDRNGG